MRTHAKKVVGQHFNEPGHSIFNMEVAAIEKVFDRALQKFSERLGGINNGSSWDNIKQEQKQRLATEYQEILSDGESRERKSNKEIK